MSPDAVIDLEVCQVIHIPRLVNRHPRLISFRTTECPFRYEDRPVRLAPGRSSLLQKFSLSGNGIHKDYLRTT